MIARINTYGHGLQGYGRELVIDVTRLDPDHKYIRSFILNGEVQRRAWFRHSGIADGGRIEILMGPEPNIDFAAQTKYLPPSLTL